MGVEMKIITPKPERYFIGASFSQHMCLVRHTIPCLPLISLQKLLMLTFIIDILNPFHVSLLFACFLDCFYQELF